MLGREVRGGLRQSKIVGAARKQTLEAHQTRRRKDMSFSSQRSASSTSVASRTARSLMTGWTRIAMKTWPRYVKTVSGKKKQCEARQRVQESKYEVGKRTKIPRKQQCLPSQRKSLKDEMKIKERNISKVPKSTWICDYSEGQETRKWWTPPEHWNSEE